MNERPTRWSDPTEARSKDPLEAQAAALFQAVNPEPLPARAQNQILANLTQKPQRSRRLTMMVTTALLTMAVGASAMTGVFPRMRELLTKRSAPKPALAPREAPRPKPPVAPAPAAPSITVAPTTAPSDAPVVAPEAPEQPAVPKASVQTPVERPAPQKRHRRAAVEKPRPAIEGRATIILHPEPVSKAKPPSPPLKPEQAPETPRPPREGKAEMRLRFSQSKSASRRPFVMAPLNPEETAPKPPVPSQERSLADEAALLRKAMRQLSQKIPRAALLTLDKYDRRYPQGSLRMESFTARLSAWLALNRRARALTLLSSLPKAHPRYAELLLLRAELRAQASLCDAALQDLERARALSWEHPERAKRIEVMCN